VTSLHKGSAETPEKQLASAVLVVYCIKKSSIHVVHLKVDQFTIPLLEMLCLRPDFEKHRCPDYEYLCQVLPKAVLVCDTSCCACIATYNILCVWH